MKADTIERIYELSPLQEGILFHSLYAPASGMYFEQFSFRFNGDIDITSLERSWQAVLNRHAVLRTSFHWKELDKPLQVVHREVKLPFDHQDWCPLSPKEQQDQLKEVLQADRERGFDLSEAPLLRLVAIRLASAVWQLVLSVHHVLLDGWSVVTVAREASSFYQAYHERKELHLEPPRPFEDYIAWLQQQDLARAEAFWRQMLDGYTGPAPFSVDRAAGEMPNPDDEYASQQATLSSATTGALQRLARTNQLTINTLIQGAWAVLLSRYTGSDDVLFGATVSGRPASLEGVESMVGLFINTLPVRVRVDPDALLLPWLKNLQKQQFEARQFEYTPLVQIHAWSEVSRAAPLFETLLGFENYPAGTLQQSSNGTVDVDHLGKTNYPLVLLVWPGDQLAVKLVHARTRFEPDTICRLLGHFEKLLTAMVETPARRLSEISMLTHDEWRTLGEWNATETTFPRDATIHQLFEEQVRFAPAAVAVSFDGDRLTYDQLNRRANRLARRLRNAGVGPETVAAICADQPIELVTGMLGILKAGGAYVPLDLTYPEERLLFMLEDSGAVALVTTRGILAKLSARGPTRISLDDPGDPSDGADDDLPNQTTAENLAYVMYTSGSTGKPKAAAIPHHAVVRTVRDTNYITLGPSDTIAQISNFSFDAATFEIWGALLNGGRLAGIPRNIVLSPADFAVALRSERISVVFVTTDLFNELVSERPDLFHGVDNVLVGGSAIDPKWIAACLRHGPPKHLLHVYGPTESTTFASWHLIDRVTEGEKTIPIGRPLANTQVHILDPAMNPVPADLAGEIYIGGDGLAQGYLNRPDLTAERFIPYPFSGRLGARLYRTGDRARRRSDGAVEFLGRLDDQVKIRGFRVEVSEIELALRRSPHVREAVVLATEDATGTRSLAAYVVPADGEVSSADLRHFLEKKLPAYMVPSAFVFHAALPLTPNGKVDRKALAALGERFAPEESYMEPSSPLEKTLTNIWAQVLTVERVGLHDNFFHLGGHSLLAMQIVSRISETLQTDVPLRALFETGTVAGLASRMIEDPDARSRLERIAQVVLDLSELSDDEVDMRLANPSARTEDSCQ